LELRERLERAASANAFIAFDDRAIVESDRTSGRELHQSNYFAYGSRSTWNALRRAGERVGLRLTRQRAIRERNIVAAVAPDYTGPSRYAASRSGGARRHR